MIKIGQTIKAAKNITSAAINATKDRAEITKLAYMKHFSNLSPIQKDYFELLKSVSGPSVHKPKAIIKNWVKAYHDNLSRQKLVDSLNAPFKKTPIINKVINKIVKG